MLNFVLPLTILVAGCVSLSPASDDPKQLSRSIFQQLIEINTTDSVGNTTKAAEAMAARLRQAGFPATDVVVLGPEPRKGNLVARLRGTGGGKPLLLIAHLDVVEARRSDWSLDPFQFVEKDGYFYGRGTSDIKDGGAILVTTMVRLKREGFQPDRDLVLALTAGEETGIANGVDWLLKNHRELIDSEFCVNLDSGYFLMQNGKRRLAELESAEKLSTVFLLEVKNHDGHSSLPAHDNAIYHLAEGLVRLERFEFPVQLNGVTRSFFEHMSAIETGPMAADMKTVLRTPTDPNAVARLAASLRGMGSTHSRYYNAQLRTTCAPTHLDTGHANNALPRTARAVVNCEILPGQTPAEVKNTLTRVLTDAQISVSLSSVYGHTANLAAAAQQSNPYSPPGPGLVRKLERVTTEMWPSVPVVPVMGDDGFTDSPLLRLAGIPTYGIAGVFVDQDDDREHGVDERIPVQSFYDGVEFYYRLTKALASTN